MCSHISYVTFEVTSYKQLDNERQWPEELRHLLEGYKATGKNPDSSRDLTRDRLGNTTAYWSPAFYIGGNGQFFTRAGGDYGWKNCIIPTTEQLARGEKDISFCR